MYRTGKIQQIIFVLLFTIALISPARIHAQDYVPPSNPGLELLKWAGEHFPYPQWTLSLLTNADGAYATWETVDPYPIVIFYQMQFAAYNYTGDEISAFVDDAWIQATVVNYEGWRELERCTNATHLVVLLNSVSDEYKYKSRMWFWSDGRRFHLIFITFPIDQSADMEAFADDFFPELPRC